MSEVKIHVESDKMNTTCWTLVDPLNVDLRGLILGEACQASPSSLLVLQIVSFVGMDEFLDWHMKNQRELVRRSKPDSDVPQSVFVIRFDPAVVHHPA